MMTPMRYHRLILFILAALICSSLAAESGKPHKPRKDTVSVVSKYPVELLDSIEVKKKFLLNDYSTIGVEYGVSRNQMSFNPVFRQKNFICPDYYGVTFTRYGKMVGFLPYFGFTVGAFYGHEGYEFKPDDETGAVFAIENATKVVYDIFEVPLLCAFHFDANYFKLMADLGPYGGYRMKVHRESPFEIAPALVDGFTDYEKRLDYGLHGGVGFAAVFTPLEFHVKLRVRYSWSSLWEPDYNSPYYYRFAYPFDFMLTAGVHFQLTKRYGKTKAMLKREAKDRVWHPENYLED